MKLNFNWYSAADRSIKDVNNYYDDEFPVLLFSFIQFWSSPNPGNLLLSFLFYRFIKCYSSQGQFLFIFFSLNSFFLCVILVVQELRNYVIMRIVIINFIFLDFELFGESNFGIQVRQSGA